MSEAEGRGRRASGPPVAVPTVSVRALMPWLLVRCVAGDRRDLLRLR